MPTPEQIEEAKAAIKDAKEMLADMELLLMVDGVGRARKNDALNRIILFTLNRQAEQLAAARADASKLDEIDHILRAIDAATDLATARRRANRGLMILATPPVAPRGADELPK